MKNTAAAAAPRAQPIAIPTIIEVPSMAAMLAERSARSE
jgi:hypothetical protein